MKSTSLPCLALAACCTFFTVGISSASAQQDAPAEPAAVPAVRPFQITLAPPLGTNGLEAARITNTISLNLFGGYNGGVRGAEFGGFFNVDKHSVKGGQFGGFLNVVGDTLTGAQFAGFLNVTRTVQGAAQFAGFANLTQRFDKGAQFAGFLNLAPTGRTGAQAAGFLNIANRAAFQSAGFLNLADTAGTQVAGFLNVARVVRGSQVGFINIADSVTGVPVGFLSVVRKGGLQEVELSGSETLQSVAAVRIGVKRFYTVLTAGANYADNFRWAYGFGIGTQADLKKGWAFDTELRAYQIVEQGWHTDYVNLLAQLRPTFSKALAPHLKLFAGPTANLIISDYPNEKGSIGTLVKPAGIESVYSAQEGRVKLTGWIGGTAGLRF